MKTAGLSGAPPAKASVAPWFLSLWALTCLGWWGLAFFPVSSGSPSWLRVAQEACFGVGPSGLPNAGGWLSLFAGPLFLLAAFAAAFADECRLLWERLSSTGAGRFLLAFVLAAIAAELGWIAWKTARAADFEDFNPEARDLGPLPDSYPRISEALPAFRLVDQEGREAGPASFKGRPTVLSFVYAHCRTVCPFLIRDSLEAAGGRARAAFITLDPWRDTPSSLPTLARSYSLPKDALLLSGSVKEVNRVLEALKIGATRDERTGELIHPSLIYILDSEGRVAYRFNNAPQGWLKEALKRLG